MGGGGGLGVETRSVTSASDVLKFVIANVTRRVRRPPCQARGGFRISSPHRGLLSGNKCVCVCVCIRAVGE